MRRREFFPPAKMPVWFNRLRYRLTGHLGYWTQEEVEANWWAAREWQERLKDLIE